MKLDLSERWQIWFSRYATEDTGGEVLYRHFHQNQTDSDKDFKCPLRELANDGFIVPSQKACQETLCAGLLSPLPSISLQRHPNSLVVRMVYILNMIWRPLLAYVEELWAKATPKWSCGHAKNHSLILSEMANGIVSSPDEGMPMDEWVQFVADTLRRIVGVTVSERLITGVAHDLGVPFTLSCTRANAYLLLRSSVCSNLVGPSLAEHVSRELLSEVAEVPVGVLSNDELARKAKQDLVDLLDQMRHPNQEVDDDRPAMKKRRGREDLAVSMKNKTEQVALLLDNRMPSSRFEETVLGATRLLSKILCQDLPQDQETQIKDILVSRQNLQKHLLYLDGALDKAMSDAVFELRENQRFAGVALATDESPPSQPRFRGLRFQITVLYYGAFRPVQDWELSETPPLEVHTALGDITHCPGKRGVDVSRIIEKQLSRVGLNCFDVVSCTGDGGGENEGSSGIHAHFEDLNPGYVRRRCLPHISWRTSDQALRTAALDYKALAAYLTDGATWSRLRAIAVQSRDLGGLELFKDGSRRCMEIFGTSPAALVTTRPETDLRFLRLLHGKEHILHLCAVKDLEQRSSLAADTKAAVENLGDVRERIKRAVLLEVVERAMFLYHWNGKHGNVVTRTMRGAGDISLVVASELSTSS